MVLLLPGRASGLGSLNLFRYETYFEVYKDGRFSEEIDRLHDIYGTSEGS
jgi:hypothetical protein